MWERTRLEPWFTPYLKTFPRGLITKHVVNQNMHRGDGLETIYDPRVNIIF